MVEPSGVKAYVYTCTDCDSENHIIAYLEKYTDEAKEARRTLSDLKIEDETPELNRDTYIGIIQGGVYVKLPKEGDWVVRDSEEGRELITKATDPRQCPEGQRLRPCSP
jgi:hypothetical protein